MDEIGFWPRLILAILATWRVTHLITREDGPADLLVRMRARLGASLLGRLMDCFACASLWVAAPVALFVSQRLSAWVVTWLAVSGAACLVERIGSEPVVIQQLPAHREGASDHGMLRSETSGAIEDDDDDSVDYARRQ